MPGPIKLTDFIQAAADLGPGRSLRLNLDRSGLVSSWGGLLVVLIRDRIFRDERQIIEEKRQVWGLFYAALKENHHDERADGIARHLAKEGLENLGGLKGAEIDRRTEGLPEKSDFPPSFGGRVVKFFSGLFGREHSEATPYSRLATATKAPPNDELDPDASLLDESDDELVFESDEERLIPYFDKTKAWLESFRPSAGEPGAGKKADQKGEWWEK